MKLVVAKDFDKMSALGTSIMLGEMLQDKRVNIAITTGVSPLGIYRNLIEFSQHHLVDNVHYYNFDELRSPSGEGEPVSITELKKAYLTPANIPEENIHRLTLENYREYDNLIKQDGGLDLMLLGLGGDGHFCGNMPYTTTFHQETYEVPILRDYHWYKTFETIYKGYEIPETFVTMGPQSILRVKKLLLVVTGENKAPSLKQLIDSPIDPLFPASILKLHPNLIILADEAAAHLL